MYIRVLGSAAGGGFPQWNCGCEQCRGLRTATSTKTSTNTLTAKARTQSSIAVSTNRQDWLLFNASPDIRSQILAYPELGPGERIRGSGITSIFLMDAQLDHTSGLLFLRESSDPLRVYCTQRVCDDLSAGYPVFKTLEHYCGVDWQDVPVHPVPSENLPFSPVGFEDLEITAIPLDGKAPPFSPNRGKEEVGDNIFVTIRDKSTNKMLLYAPGIGSVPDSFETFVSASDCLLLEGSFWHQDDMERSGCGVKTAADMGHIHLAGPDGLLNYLDQFSGMRKVLIHINNTNPILNEEGPEREILDAHGVEVSEDGWLIEL